MKDTLTTEELELIPLVRDERINKVNNPKPIDRETATPLIERLYGLAGLKKPQVIYVDSPYGAQIAANMLQGTQVQDKVRYQVRDQVEAQVGDQVIAQVRDKVRDKVRDQVRDQVGDQVGAQVRVQVGEQVEAQVRDKVRDQVRYQVIAKVRDQVRAQVGAQVQAQVRDKVRDKVRDQVRVQVGEQVEAQVREQVGDQIGDQVKAQVGAQVQAQVRDKVLDKVGAQVRDQVGDQVGEQVEAQVGDQVIAEKIEYYSFASYANISDYGRLAYHSFFKKIGIVKDNNFDKFVQLMECGIYDMIQLDGLCIVCGMPSSIKRDDKHRMNNTEGYAIEWADGYGQHYIHGIYFDDEAREVFKDKDVKQIINRANQDQKRAMLMEVDYSQMLTELNAELVNEMLDDDKNIMRLYKIDLGDDEEPGLFYEAIDPSKNEKIVLRVSPTAGIETALQAKIRTWKHLWDWVQKEKGNTIKFIQET